MRVQLVQPSTGAYQSNSRSGCYVPLGLVSIATYLRQQEGGAEIEILDAELVGQAGVLEALDADIVGINANTVTYPQALEVAECAKSMGARVALGGVFPSALPELILERHSELIDCVVVGAGERPFLDFCRGDVLGLVRNPLPSLDLVPIPDRSEVDLEAYVDRFATMHPSWRSRGTNIFTNVGCFWRDGKNPGCLFCSRSGSRVATRRPDYIWQEVQNLVDSYGIEYLVDFSDTILQHHEWIESVADARPSSLEAPDWHVFARIDEVNDSSLDSLERLPCRHIFVGIESGDPVLYRKSVKGGGSPREALEMAKLLAFRGVDLTPSYVLGLPGETEKSLNETLTHARQLKEICPFEEIFCCPLIPFPGSPAFELLRRRVPMATDVLDIEELQALWARTFCEVPIEVLREYADRILALGRYRITIAKTESEPLVVPPALVGAEVQVGHNGIYTCA